MKVFPDFHLTIDEQISEGEKVIPRVTFSGTHLGEFRRVAPPGKKIAYMGMALLLIKLLLVK